MVTVHQKALVATVNLDTEMNSVVQEVLVVPVETVKLDQMVGQLHLKTYRYTEM